MYEFVDPLGRAKTAKVALMIYAALQLVEMGATAFFPPDSMTLGIAALVMLAGLLGAIVATGYWIHRVNANAHSFADGLTITPGWNVGWFFVPIANLYKPFEGIKEVWQASEDPAEWPRVPVPGLLRWWWGCWIGGNILSNGAMRVGNYVDRLVWLTIDLLSSALMIAAAFLLVRIIAELSRRQPIAHASHAFA